MFLSTPMDYFLCAFCAAFSLIVVFHKNPIVSAFSLLLAFVGFGGIYFRLGSVFLTTIQILVYAGAIAILFVFVLMLMNLSEPEISVPKKNLGFVAASICTVLFLGIIYLVIYENTEYLDVDKLPIVSMKSLFEPLFGKYLVPFELASMLLLGAIIAVVFMTKRHFGEEKR